MADSFLDSLHIFINYIIVYCSYLFSMYFIPFESLLHSGIEGSSIGEKSDEMLILPTGLLWDDPSILKLMKLLLPNLNDVIFRS